MGDPSEPVYGSRFSTRKFNPGLLQSDEELVSQFVVREFELNRICEILKSNIDAPACQHMVIVGSSGQGKTMLLRRVAASLRMDAELSNHFLPVVFMEENHEVNSLADFWMETLYQLAQSLLISDPDTSNELLGDHESLKTRWLEREFEILVRAHVLGASSRLDKRLVVMVENIQSLFAIPDDEFGWQLRFVLQNMPQITLIGSTPRPIEAFRDPREAFFEFFRTYELNPLTTKECAQLWSNINGTELAANEIKPLEILTGGNPRLLAGVASVEKHYMHRQLMQELALMIDDHSEYFRSYLDQLPPKEKRVFVSLLDLWQPSNTSDIAIRARMDIRIVSTMLKRLIGRGAVSVIERHGPRKRLYFATERLFSIYFKLRHDHREPASIESLTHFMTAFYGMSQLDSTVEHSLINATENTTSQLALKDAIDYGLTGDFQQEIKHFENVIHSTHEKDGPEFKTSCFYARIYKCRRLAELGRAEEALASCDQLRLWLEENPGFPTEIENVGFDWFVNSTLALGLVHSDRTTEALVALKNAYEAFDSAREGDLAQLLRLVSELIAGGVEEQDLITVFDSDDQKAKDLLPLLVMLHQRTGSVLNAPIEVSEVAKDINKCVEHRLAEGPQPGYSLNCAIEEIESKYLDVIARPFG